MLRPGQKPLKGLALHLHRVCRTLLQIFPYIQKSLDQIPQ